jgi:hypothetical protein
MSRSQREVQSRIVRWSQNDLTKEHKKVSVHVATTIHCSVDHHADRRDLQYSSCLQQGMWRNEQA